MRYLKTLIKVALIAIVIVPIGLNFLCLTVFPAPIVGDGKVWLDFWGTYLGGIITVLSAIYVLYENQKKEREKKEYEIQKEHFESLCKDMGQLCSSINTSMLSFCITNLKKLRDAISITPKIGEIDNEMMKAYNEFCLLHSHDGGEEKNNFLNACQQYEEAIRNSITSVMEAVTDWENGTIQEAIYDAKIRQICNELEDLGNIGPELFRLAERWKKKEWNKLEELRIRYVYE